MLTALRHISVCELCISSLKCKPFHSVFYLGENIFFARERQHYSLFVRMEMTIFCFEKRQREIPHVFVSRWNSDCSFCLL
jgi:hypothetical protein